MKNTSKKTYDLVLLAMFTAIILLLAFIPGLGYIPLGAIRATTVHIPVIIGSIVLGPKKGAILGAVFGLTSLINNTISPVATSFVFSPFYSLGDTGGNFWSLIICFVPRILTGVTPYWVYRLMCRILRKSEGALEMVSLGVAGFLGSMTNTLLVMNMIYIFFGASYAAATNRVYETLYSAITVIIGINGSLEAIVATILSAAIAKVLLRQKRRMGG